MWIWADMWWSGDGAGWWGYSLQCAVGSQSLQNRKGIVIRRKREEESIVWTFESNKQEERRAALVPSCKKGDGTWLDGVIELGSRKTMRCCQQQHVLKALDVKAKESKDQDGGRCKK